MRLDLSFVDAKELLEGLGVTNISHSGNDELAFSCLYPEHSFGDRNPSASMNATTTAWICYSCGRSGSALTMLADLHKVSRATAWRWLCERWAPHPLDVADLERQLAQLDVEDRKTREIPQVLAEEVLDERRVDWHLVEKTPTAPPALRYLIERGFSADVLARSEVCYDRVSDRPCVVVRDENGRLVGLKGRAWNEHQQPRYLICGDTDRSIVHRGIVYGFSPYDASHYVYGLHDVVADAAGQIVVVEGELNVVAMRDLGFLNTVAPSGSTFSRRQVQLVVEHAESVVVFFDYDLSDDPDDERQRLRTERAIVKMMSVVADFERYVPTYLVAEHRGDPADIYAYAPIRSLIDSARSSVEIRFEAQLMS